MPTILSTENLEIGYQLRKQKKVLLPTPLNVNIKGGELVCLLGSNGVGKSTFLQTLAGLQPAMAGRVLINGLDVHKISLHQKARSISLVLTQKIQASMLSAFELVSFGRYPYTNWLGNLTSSDIHYINKVLKEVGAYHLKNSSVNELSDGECQRIMIARALAQDTSIMLMDEVTAYLDVNGRISMMKLLRNLTRTTGKAIIVSTHDLDLALRYADRICILSKTQSFAFGIPEVMVLGGAFEKMFQEEQMRFDRIGGVFTVEETFWGQYIIISDKRVAKDYIIWTEKALRRIGLTNVEEKENKRIDQQIVFRLEITLFKDRVSWIISKNSSLPHLFHSMESLLEHLISIQKK